MKTLRTLSLPALMALLVLSLYSCKSKKMVTKPAAPQTVKETPPAPEKAPEPAPVEEKAAPAPKPDFNFNSVHFEFNSAVLKTDSYTILDQVAIEMKKDPSSKFIVNGHSSKEGTDEHNMSLSVDRANAVKSYLVNAGIDAANFTIKGFGSTKPVASNDTETGRQQNRRVEIKTVN